MILKYFPITPVKRFILAVTLSFTMTFIMVFVMASNCNGVEIIVNASVPDKSYTEQEVRSIFAMQRRIWTNGKKIQVFVLADDNPLHREFTKTKLNMFPHQFRRIWDRMLFSGTGQSPRQVASPAKMIEKISTVPNSIGYAGSPPENKNIRILNYE